MPNFAIGCRTIPGANFIYNSGMNYLQIENITKSYGDKVLFQNISLLINKGDKIALVAKNGSGKTTLLRVIAGLESGEGEQSKIVIRKDIRIGYLEQEPNLDLNKTVLETLLSTQSETAKVVADYEKALASGQTDELSDLISKMDDLKAWDFEARVKETLAQFKIYGFDQPVGQLSGGQKKRLALAALLLDEPEFLILDEPTNHLDLDMIEWLEVELNQSTMTLFMVTHDRYFLDNVCNNILELERGQIHKYKGNYADFLEKKEIRLQNEAVEGDKLKQLYKQELDWMRRQPQARTTKAKSRITEFQTIEEKHHSKSNDDKLQIDLQSNRLGSKILELHYVNKAFGSNVLIKDFFYKFNKRDRIGIVGPNGAGKSTLLRILTGSEKPDSGKVIIGETTDFGYYTQEGLPMADDKRVIDVIQDIAEFVPLEKGKKLTAPQLLERFLFSRSQQQVFVSQLSGGERRRLYLLTILMRNPNFLILDEPTNDLDIMTLNVLEDYLSEFPGCLIVVTHDRYFLDRIVEHLFVLEGEGNIKDYNGTYSEYRVQAKAALETKTVITEKPKAEPVPSNLSHDERKELMRLEKDIEKLEKEIAAITMKFDDASLSLDQIQKLSAELQVLQGKQEDKEMRWMELTEKAES